MSSVKFHSLPLLIDGSTLYFVQSFVPLPVLINTSTLFSSPLLSNAVPETVIFLFTVLFSNGSSILTFGGLTSFCKVKSGTSCVLPALSVSLTITAPSASFACGILAVNVPLPVAVSFAVIAGVNVLFPILTISAVFSPLPPAASLAVNSKLTIAVLLPISFVVTPVCPSTLLSA